MQTIFDHLSAVFIAALVILMLVGVQMRGQQASIESTINSMVKSQANSLMQVFSEDLENIGAGTSAESVCQIRREERGTAPNTHDMATTFMFTSFDNNDADGTTGPIHVKYEIEPAAPAATVDAGGPAEDPLYHFERYTADGTAPAPALTADWGDPSGQSTDILIRFNIAFMNVDGTIDDDQANASCTGNNVDALQVEFVTAMQAVGSASTGPAGSINTARYAGTIAPPNMPFE